MLAALDRQSSRLPGFDSAIENVGLGIRAIGQRAFVHAGAGARFAVEDDYRRCIVQWHPHPRQRMVAGAGNILGRILILLTDIDEQGAIIDKLDTLT